MNTLWVIHLDKSGSMGDPFSGQSDFEGIVEKGPYRIKLEAAKDFLLKQIKGIQGGDIAVVTFDSHPRLIYKGSVRNAKSIEDGIKVLKADGGTDIAATLLFTITDLGDVSEYNLVRALIISDGLSEEERAIAAAKVCASKSIAISTILIDPTPQGERLAREISIGGDVKAVTSEFGLHEAIASEGKSYAMASEAPPAAPATPAAPREGPLLKVIAAIAAFSGLSVTISSVYTSIAERPNIAIPTLLAAIATISASICMYLVFVKEKSERGFYTTPDAQNMHFPRYYKYNVRTRIYASLSSLICITLASLVVLNAYSSNMFSNKKAAEIAVSQFHDQLNDSAFKEIYQQSDEHFRSLINKERTISEFASVRRCLGRIQRAELIMWDHQYGPTQTKIGCLYNTKFSEGCDVWEQFIWSVSRSKAMLNWYGYVIQGSPNCLTRLVKVSDNPLESNKIERHDDPQCVDFTIKTNKSMPSSLIQRKDDLFNTGILPFFPLTFEGVDRR